MKSKREIKLPIDGIVITLHEDDEDEDWGCEGTITSNLDRAGYNDQVCAGLDAIESMILEHACVGVDVGDTAYLVGIETAQMALFKKWEKDEKKISTSS